MLFVNDVQYPLLFILGFQFLKLFFQSNNKISKNQGSAEFANLLKSREYSWVWLRETKIWKYYPATSQFSMKLEKDIYF